MGVFWLWYVVLHLLVCILMTCFHVCLAASVRFKARLIVQAGCIPDLLASQSPWVTIGAHLAELCNRGNFNGYSREAISDLCRGLLWLNKNRAGVGMPTLKRTNLLNTLAILTTGKDWGRIHWI